MKYLIITVLALLSSCYYDTKNVVIEGRITDNISGKPLSQVEVSIICWRYGNTPDGSYTSYDSAMVFTNELGMYLCKFNKGAFAEVRASKANYESKLESHYLDNKRNIVNINLIRFRKNE